MLFSFKSRSVSPISQLDTFFRQIDLLESGQQVIQETRRWDDNKEYSYAMRSKEDEIATVSSNKSAICFVSVIIPISYSGISNSFL